MSPIKTVRTDGRKDESFGLTTRHPHTRSGPQLAAAATAHSSSSSSTLLASTASSAAAHSSTLAVAAAAAALPSLHQRHDDKVDLAELEETRKYLMTSGKFRTSPSKLLSSLEVAKVTHGRPVSAPGYAHRRATAAAPKAGAWKRRAVTSTLFRKYYARGDLPICVDHKANGNAIKWKMRTADLDFHVYLPIFFDGLREVSVCCNVASTRSLFPSDTLYLFRWCTVAQTLLVDAV
jgi:Parkin co-regulated protein